MQEYDREKAKERFAKIIGEKAMLKYLPDGSSVKIGDDGVARIKVSVMNNIINIPHDKVYLQDIIISMEKSIKELKKEEYMY